MEPENVERLLWVMAAMGFAMAALGIVGEVLGWWNAAGEVLVTVGGTLGALLSAAGVVFSSSRRQVTVVASGVRDVGAKLDRVGRQLDGMDLKLDNLEKLDNLDTLDVIQVQLDRQTGVLDRQLAVLSEIRDHVA